MLINLDHTGLYKAQGIQQTYFASPGTVGTASIPVKNIGGFINHYAIGIGQAGEETAEICMIGSVPAGTALSLGTLPANTAGTLKYPHATDTPIYQIHYDQLILYRSTSGTAGAFSALATVNIQPDNLYTQYDDTAGAATYAYYAQYYNSVSGDLSGSSSIFTPSGASYYSLQKIRQRVKDKLYSAGYIRDDSLITDWVNEWLEDMTNTAIKVNQNYMVGTVGYGFGTAGLGTVTASDFKVPVKLEVTWDSGVTYTPSSEIPLQDFSDGDYFTKSYPRHSWIGETVLQVLPKNTAGSVRLTYAQRFTPLVNDSDELTQTLKAYTLSCVEYCLSVAYGLDQKGEAQQEHYQKYQKSQADFVSQIVPRDQTGIKTITITDEISGSDGDLDASTGYIY